MTEPYPRYFFFGESERCNQQGKGGRIPLQSCMLFVFVAFGFFSLVSQTRFCWLVNTSDHLSKPLSSTTAATMTTMMIHTDQWKNGSNSNNKGKISSRERRLQQWLDYLNVSYYHQVPPQPESTYLPCFQYQETNASNNNNNKNENENNDGLTSFASCNVMMHVRPPKYERRVPPKTKSNRTASLCLFIKNEQLYVNEYIDYHLALGFDEIFIYDNSPDFNLEHWGRYKQEQCAGRVRVTHFPGRTIQNDAYEHCRMTSIGRNHTWMGVMDADEILVLHQHDHVVDLLEDYCQHGALSLYWHVFGHANQTRYRPFPLAQRFLYRAYLPNAEYKTIGKLSDIVMADMHYMKVRNGTITTPLQPGANGPSPPSVVISQHNILGHNLRQEFKAPDAVRIQCNQVASVKHYWLKSVEEWFLKACWRGRPKDKNQYFNCQRKISGTMGYGDVYDDTAWQALKKFVPEYANFDDKF